MITHITPKETTMQTQIDDLKREVLAYSITCENQELFDYRLESIAPGMSDLPPLQQMTEPLLVSPEKEFERGRKQGLEEATHVCDNEKWDHQTGAYTIRYIDTYNGACDDCMKAIGRLS